MDDTKKKMLDYLTTIEEKGVEILIDKQEIIGLDKRRNDDRVGMRALQQQKADKCWITVGPLIMKMDSKKAEELLKNDQKQCDIQINILRSDLKVKVNELRKMEYNPPVPGLNLKPMSKEEMSALNQIWGQSV
ncbi:p53 and DNA damage-regulated protein 1-like isoform X3 [Trichogramma pretiosum]|uniref:P53 and DNA damage-regulated protein 1 n=1 Tax=Trichogramma kaykai TaxID=54128 RepID=A0ABD2W0I1_9HYME|nr:p53 and DNA damage-regulated protein 1-like isoform X3 [Trichogramma pretiosum]XP_023316206.1 p53 and DNA damage-regulated protein 1-like isoform X3 [Trichogramma pretiosum]